MKFNKAWKDKAERLEWNFMVKALNECEKHIPIKLSILGVARDIAKERSEKGWRTMKF